MSIYYIIIIWLAAFGLVTAALNMKRAEFVCGVKEYRVRPIWALVAILPLLYLCVTRDFRLGDTYNYMTMYRDMPGGFAGLMPYIKGLTKDVGFFIFSAFIKVIFGSDIRIYFFIIAAIQGIILVKVYRKYSSDYITSLFLFFASTDYISWMCNGIRQFLAVVVTFACLPLILRKKYFKAVIIILLASTLHGTALLMLPFIFILQGKAWNKNTLLFIFAVIIAVVFVDQFTDVLDKLLEDTQYQNVISDWQGMNDNGTNLLRVLVYSIPAILSLVGLKYIRRANDPVINLCTNMSIVSTGLYIISMFTSGIMVGRLPIYFSLYSYILLPWEIDNMFTKSSARFIKVVMVIAYLAFYLYSMNMMELI